METSEAVELRHAHSQQPLTVHCPVLEFKATATFTFVTRCPLVKMTVNQ